MSRRSISAALTTAVFLTISLLPVVLFTFDGPWLGRGEIAIRPKAPRPFRFTPAIYKEFDQWFADRVGLRYPLIYLASRLHVDGLQRPIDKHIFFGRDGWMFWTDNAESTPATMADVRGRLRFKLAEIQRIETQMLAIRERFAACHIPLAVMIAPNKQSIYGEFVLDAGTTPPKTRLDVMLESLSAPVRDMIVDPRPMLRDAKRRHTPDLLFPKTESHWNGLGAYYGYRAAYDRLSQLTAVAHPGRAAFGAQTFSKISYSGGDMAMRVLLSPWRFQDEYTQIIHPDWVRESQLSHRDYLARNPEGKGRLLLFGDSFGNQIAPFMAHALRRGASPRQLRHGRRGSREGPPGCGVVGYRRTPRRAPAGARAQPRTDLPQRPAVTAAGRAQCVAQPCTTLRRPAPAATA